MFFFFRFCVPVVSALFLLRFFVAVGRILYGVTCHNSMIEYKRQQGGETNENMPCIQPVNARFIFGLFFSYLSSATVVLGTYVYTARV